MVFRPRQILGATESGCHRALGVRDHSVLLLLWNFPGHNNGAVLHVRRILALEFATHLHTPACLRMATPQRPLPSPAKTNSSAGIHSHPATQHGTDPSWRLAALTPGLTVSPDFRPQPGCANETDEGPQPSSRPLSTRHNSNPPLDEGAPRGAVYLRRLSQLPGDWRELHCALQWHRLLMAT